MDITWSGEAVHESRPSFLVVRRDNIGDLICTTPLIHALRQHYPGANICALVNSYNAPVLANNPDVDSVFAYTKAKHRPAGVSAARVYWDRLKLFARLRKMHFDYAILAAPRFQPRLLRLAKFAGARHIVGFTEGDHRAGRHIDVGVPYGSPISPLHEVEDVFRLLAPIGISGCPPSALIHPGEEEIAEARTVRQNSLPQTSRQLIGVHVSARKPSQRWPAQNFAATMQRLHENYGAAFMLFWSPGDTNNRLHPGDDAKAEAIIQATAGLPVLAYPTRNLGQLIAGLSLCDKVICSDGGAMHIAAGLNKPMVCFFGKSDATRWHPWGVPHVLLQPESLDVADISVEQALRAFEALLDGKQ